MRSILVRALALSLLVVACGNDLVATIGPTAASSPVGSFPAAASPPSGPSSTPGDPGVSIQLTILAASSLTTPLEDAKVAFEAAHPGVTLNITTDSSATLEAQIEQGAYADVFLSADTTNPQKLVDGGFAEGDTTSFASNELTIVVPTSNPAEIESWKDLAAGSLKVIAAGEQVPITSYAMQLIDNLAARPDAPAGFADAYASSIVSREENVKAVVAKIELGEGDAAIVYVTDARTSTKVATVDVPASANVTAIYAGVVVKVSDHVLWAESFLDWVAGPEGQAILATYGFVPPTL